MRIYCNNDWKFTKEFSESLLIKDNQNAMEDVRLPHTVAETPFSYFDEGMYQMISGYSRNLYIDKAWEGKRLLLTFEGVAHEATVYMNGGEVCKHSCGYTAFTVDISEQVAYGVDNRLVVKVNSREDINIPPFGYVIDYMTYGGIYRDVYLEIKHPQYIQDVFYHTELDMPENAILTAEVSVSQITPDSRIRIMGKKVGGEEILFSQEHRLENTELEIMERVSDVSYWDVEHPHLYEITMELLQGAEVVDKQVHKIGFREAVFKKDGFYLNGKKIKIRGLNRHQSYPYVGYAMPASMQKMDADILKKELGLNAVRTSHYPQSHYFLDRCDELGLLVFTELPGWQYIGDEEWKEQAVKNVEEMILQYRNHTSIILWGVRINESQDDDALYIRTNKVARQLDATRQTGGVRAIKKSSLLEDVYTYNDFVHNGKTRGCEPKKKVTSNAEKPYLITEYNGHMYPTKSYDTEGHRLEHALRHTRVLDAVAGEEDICGSFGWCMADYNTHKDFGSGDRVCHHGVLDMFRNPKLAAAVYASQQENEPVLKISSSMNIGEYPGGNMGQIYMFTNADSVRLYKNDNFIAEFAASSSDFYNLTHGPIVLWDIVGNSLVEEEHFSKGKAKIVKNALNAVATYGLDNLPKRVIASMLWAVLRYGMTFKDAYELYGKYIGNWGESSTSYRFEAIQNDLVVSSVTKEPMKRMVLWTEADHQVLQEGDTYDVAAIRIRAVDENGNLLSFCNEPVTIETTGTIQVIGPTNTGLKGGMGGTYIKSIGEAGKGRVTLSMHGASAVTLEFEVVK